MKTRNVRNRQWRRWMFRARKYFPELARFTCMCAVCTLAPMTAESILERVTMNQENFIRYGKWMEERWGPHGWERKERREYHYHRELIAQHRARTSNTRV